ncbi:MAG: DUF4199 domain-containing protein [Bacteroidota bacterium]
MSEERNNDEIEQPEVNEFGRDPGNFEPEPEELELSEVWPVLLQAGALIGLLSFTLNLVFGYLQITSEPSGSLLLPLTGGIGVFLITCTGGFLTIRQLGTAMDLVLSRGRAALIGFLTGAVIVTTSALLNELWYLLDPDYTDKLVRSMVETVKQMDLPDNSRQDMMDQMAAGVDRVPLWTQIFYGTPVTGLLNLVSALIGMRWYVKKSGGEA